MELKWYHYALLSIAIVVGVFIGQLCLLGERSGVIP